MDYLLFFLIIIGAAFLLPELAKKIHLPYVTSIILAGIIIGPYGFKLFDLGDIASFLAFLGAIFLMFTAGLDVGLSSLRKIGKKAIIENMPMQPGDVDITYADISKSKNILGYNPKTLIKDGLPKFIDWFNGTK